MVELPDGTSRAFRHATQLITEALDLLDAASAPPQITAHLELALAELRKRPKTPH